MPSTTSATTLPASRPSRVVVEAVAPARRRRGLPRQGDGRRAGHRARRRVHRRPRPRRRRAALPRSAARRGARSRWSRSATTASRPRSCPTSSGAGSTRSSAGSTTSARGATAWSSSWTPASTSPSTCRSASASSTRPLAAGQRATTPPRSAPCARPLAAGDTRPLGRLPSEDEPRHGDGHVPDLDDVEPEHDGPDARRAVLAHRGAPAGRRARPTARPRGRPRAGPVQRLVRVLPPLDAGPGDRPRHAAPTPSSASTTSPRWASTSSTCRRSTRSARPSARAATTRRHPAPDDVGSPWAIGAPEGGHTAVHPELGTVDDVAQLAVGLPRAGHRAGPRPRLPVHARPPVGHRAPGVVRPPARRHDPVRREPAQEVPGHLPARLRERRLAGPVDGAGRRHPVLDRRRRHDLPRRQPAHQGVRLLGVDDRHDPQRAPRGDLPGRGVHPAAGDGAAGQDRVQPVVHVLHVAPVVVGAAPVLRGPGGAAPSTTSAPTSGRTRPTSSPSSCRPADRRCSPSGPSSPPRCRRRGASTARRSSCWSTCRCGPDRRSTSTRRSTSCASGTSTAPTAWPRCSGGSTAIRREQPALAHLRTLRFHQTDNPRPAVLLEDRPGRRRRADPRRRQPRRPQRQHGHRRRRPAAARPAVRVGLRRRRPARPTPAYRWHGARNFVDLDPSSPAHVFRVDPA